MNYSKDKRFLLQINNLLLNNSNVLPTATALIRKNVDLLATCTGCHQYVEDAYAVQMLLCT